MSRLNQVPGDLYRCLEKSYSGKILKENPLQDKVIENELCHPIPAAVMNSILGK